MSITKLRAEMIARKSYSSEKRKRRLCARNVSIIGVGYRYDCFDRRIAKIVDSDPANVAVNSSPTTFYVYDGVNVRMEFTKTDGIAGGAPAALSVRYFNGQGVDNVLAQENYSPNAVPGQIGSTYWLLKDQVGSTTDVLNANGQQVNHIDYTTFGQFQILDPNTGTYTLSGNPPAGTVTTHLFTGREFDAETGNYYYRAREYSAGAGRFLSEDPLFWIANWSNHRSKFSEWLGSDTQSDNLYAYAGNAPTDFIDPLGLTRRSDFYASNARVFMEALQQPSLESLQLYIEANEGVLSTRQIEVAKAIVNVLEKAQAAGITPLI
jgi:RHS repeat-associated protein